MRITIYQKLLGVSAAVLALMGLVGWIGISNLGVLSGVTSSMYDNQVAPIEDLWKASDSLHEMRIAVSSTSTSWAPTRPAWPQLRSR